MDQEIFAIQTDRGLESQRLQAVGLMTTGIAHDLGNMAQVVASAIHCVERSLRDRRVEDVEAAMTAARDSVDRFGALTRRILHFSRPGDQDHGSVNVAGVLDTLAQPFGWMLGPTTSLRIEVQRHTPLIACDEGALENALLNLVINARDAMPEGGQLSIRAFSSQSDSVTVEVTDTGVGMAPETAARALQPFFTTNRWESEQALASRPFRHSSGIGTDTSKSIARLA
jgi:signal transduction histidine kinase